MNPRRAYCSAVDRMVPVVLKAGAAPRDRVTLRDPADLICLDYKVRCTGWCCPLFSVDDDTDGRADPDRPGAVASTARAAAPVKKPRTETRWTRRT